MDLKSQSLSTLNEERSGRRGDRFSLPLFLLMFSGYGKDVIMFLWKIMKTGSHFMLLRKAIYISSEIGQ